MPEEDAHQRQLDEDGQRSSRPATPRHDWKDVFTLPRPLKDLFARFPLVTYPSNTLPARSLKKRDAHTLYIFTTDSDASNGAPSFNPSCLKWQLYLKLRDVDFQVVASNNHASPTGALPFLIPAHSTASKEIPSPIPSNKLEKWVQGGQAVTGLNDMRAVTHLSLINHSIRRAWLYQLYIQPDNFRAVAEPLYIHPGSTNSLVRAATSHQLRKAALDELLKTTPKLSPEDLIRDGAEALSALSTLLGSSRWFLAAEERPGLFDASVFAYTHLLLDDDMGWKSNELGDVLRSLPNLVEHRDRILRMNF